MFCLRLVLSGVLALLVLAPAALAQSCIGGDISHCNINAGANPVCRSFCYYRSCNFPSYTQYGNAVIIDGFFHYLCKSTLNGSVYRSRRDLDTCPGTEQRCPVMYGCGGTECIDVMSNAESCGGCLLEDEDDSGVDCTEIPGAAAVQCKKGQCVIDECYEGYRLDPQHSSCTPIPGMRIQKDTDALQGRW